MDLLNFDIDKSPKIYYSIGELAKMLDVNTSLVRFWEKEFEILKPKKNNKGNRQFTKDDVKNCHLIYHLVKGAKDVLKSDISGLKNQKLILDKMVKIKSFLLKLKEQL